MSEDGKKKFVYTAPKAGRSILWPCIIIVPVDNGVIERELTARFSLDHTGAEKHDLLMAEAAKQSDPDKYTLDKVLLGFDGVEDENGAPVPDIAMRPLAYSEVYIRRGLVTGYLNMRVGYLPKNFAAPSAS